MYKKEIQLTQVPCLFSVYIYADNERFGRYLDEYPIDNLIRNSDAGPCKQQYPNSRLRGR